MLSQVEKELYDRHLTIPGFGEDMQEKLSNARVLIAGAGGLGSSVGYYLAAAGVGVIGIADADKVSLSNLQRQILYNFGDLGEMKAEAAARRLSVQNPFIRIEPFEMMVTDENARDLILNYDVVVGALDNSKTRYLLNDTCLDLGKPYIHGAISIFEGQVAVFNFKGGKSYRDVFPEPPAKDFFQPGDKGVLAPLPGIIGTIMASEVIKVVTGCGEPLSNKMLVIDIKNNKYLTIGI